MNLNQVRQLVAHIEHQIVKTGRKLSESEEELLIQAKLALANKPIRKPMSEEKVDDLRHVALGVPATKKRLSDLNEDFIQNQYSKTKAKTLKDATSQELREHYESRQVLEKSRPEALPANPKRCLRTLKVAEMDARLARLLGVSQAEPVSETVNTSNAGAQVVILTDASLNPLKSVVIKNLGINNE